MKSKNTGRKLKLLSLILVVLSMAFVGRFIVSLSHADVTNRPFFIEAQKAVYNGPSNDPHTTAQNTSGRSYTISFKVYNVPSGGPYYLPIALSGLYNGSNAAGPSADEVNITACSIRNCQLSGQHGTATTDMVGCVALQANMQSQIIGSVTFATPGVSPYAYTFVADTESPSKSSDCSGSKAINPATGQAYDSYRIMPSVSRKGDIPAGSAPDTTGDCAEYVFPANVGHFGNYTGANVSSLESLSCVAGISAGSTPSAPKTTAPQQGSGSKGTGTQGTSGGASSSQQSSQSQSVTPTTTTQGTTEQPKKITPSPFYDGKQYAAGSDTDTLKIAGKTASKKSVQRGVLVAVGLLTIIIIVMLIILRRKRRDKAPGPLL